MHRATYNRIRSTLTHPPFRTDMKKALLVAAFALCASAPALADLALATAKNCMSCHMVERKVLGPSFKDVAAKYKDNKGAVDLLAGKIVKGGSGVWGTVAMPPQPQVKDADARSVVQWILGGAK